MKPLTACLLLTITLLPFSAWGGTADPAGRPLPPRSSEPLPATLSQERVQPGEEKSDTLIPERPIQATGASPFQLTSSGCIAGRHFSVVSQSGSASKSQEWYLKVPDAMVLLKKSIESSEQLTLTVPDTVTLQPMQRYPLYFNSMSQAYSGLEVFFCPETGAASTPRRKGELLILISHSERQAVLQQLQKQRLTVIEDSPFMGKKHLLTIRVDKDEHNLSQQIDSLKRHFPGLIVDYNDFYFQAERARLYARDALNWPEKACLKTHSGAIKVGIIDGVLDHQHPTIADHAVISKRFVDKAASETEHATAIAVILVGESENKYLKGLIPEAHLFSAEVVEPSTDGDAASVSAIVQALNWLQEQETRLVNLSLSGDRPNIVLQMALRYARHHGMLVFAAAGNEGYRQQPAYPAAFEEVFAITAVDAAYRLYNLANQGNYIDFAAPGVDLWTASSGKKGQYRSGTSYAAPHALAVASVLLQINPAMSADLLYESLRQLSKDLGSEGHDHVYGWGLLQYPEYVCE
ncbi:S8 family serine peptidase [Methylophaga sp.]|uniref:S8 family serine peptidase n=1 Tax=Methylophaga sp. TaxID=2024840 RepID=UPI003F696FB7